MSDQAELHGLRREKALLLRRVEELEKQLIAKDNTINALRGGLQTAQSTLGEISYRIPRGLSPDVNR